MYHIIGFALSGCVLQILAMGTLAAPAHTHATESSNLRPVAQHIDANEPTEDTPTANGIHSDVETELPSWRSWGGHMLRIPLRAFGFALQHPLHTLLLGCALLPQLVSGAPTMLATHVDNHNVRDQEFLCPDGHPLNQVGWILRQWQRFMFPPEHHAAIDTFLCTHYPAETESP